MARLMCITGDDINELRRRKRRCRRCMSELDRSKKNTCSTCNNGANQNVTSDLIHVDTNDENTKLNTTCSPIYDNLNSQQAQQGSPYQISNLESHLNEVKKSIQRMELKFENRQALMREEQLDIREWKSCAMVIDRFLFILYVLLISLSLIILFPRPEDEMKRFMKERQA